MMGIMMSIYSERICTVLYCQSFGEGCKARQIGESHSHLAGVAVETFLVGMLDHVVYQRRVHIVSKPPGDAVAFRFLVM